MNAILTIDDSPSSHFLKKVDFLANHNVPAVFFCEGIKLEKRRHFAVRALEEHDDFVLGNHSYTHTHFSKLSLEEGKSEIRKTDEILDAIYEEAGRERPVKWFRFPYGDKGDDRRSGCSKKREELQSYLRSLGYSKPTFGGITYDWYHNHELQQDVDWFWTFNARSYEADSFDDIKENVDKDDSDNMFGLQDKSSNDILLYHDHENTHGWFMPFMQEVHDCVDEFVSPHQL